MEFFLSGLIGAFIYLVLQDYKNRNKISALLPKDFGHKKDAAGHWIHEDEPLICPVCGKEFYRWQWTEAEDNDPTFRTRFYNHVLIAGIYRLPCVTCAVDKVEEIKTINGTVWNAEAKAYNKLTQAQRKKEWGESWMVSSAPGELPKYFPNMTMWKPGDD